MLKKEKEKLCKLIAEWEYAETPHAVEAATYAASAERLRMLFDLSDDPDLELERLFAVISLLQPLGFPDYDDPDFDDWCDTLQARWEEVGRNEIDTLLQDGKLVQYVRDEVSKSSGACKV